jgi:hypothetical protein
MRGAMTRKRKMLLGRQADRKTPQQRNSSCLPALGETIGTRDRLEDDFIVTTKTRRGIPMTLDKETTKTWEGRQGNLRWCEHDYPMLVVETKAGYYARCIGCLRAGPERLSGEAARKALRVLGVRDATATTR